MVGLQSFDRNTRTSSAPKTGRIDARHNWELSPSLREWAEHQKAIRDLPLSERISTLDHSKVRNVPGVPRDAAD